MATLPTFAKQFLEEHRQESIDLLLEYARIPAPFHGEQKRAAYIKNYLEKCGAKDIIVDEECNVICPIGCTDESTGIHVISAHMDTVYPDTTPLPVEIHEDGRMVGPGVGDNSSSVASLLRAHEIVLRNHLQAKEPVIILYDAGEESPNNLRGMRHFIRTYGDRIKDVIAIDADISHTFDAIMSRKIFNITIHGESGNAYIDSETYVGAIDEASRLMTRAHAIAMPESFKTVQYFRSLKGTTDVAELRYTVCSQSWQCCCEVEQALMQVIDDMRATGRRIECELVSCLEGREDSFNEALKHRIEDAYAALNLPAITWNPSPGDVVPPLLAGIPAVGIGSAICGPGHRRDEWLDTNFVQTGAELITSLLLDYFEV